MAIVVQDLEVIRPDGAMLFSGVSFHVGDKEHTALIGVNGVGKSTLLRVLAGELRQSQGSIQIDGRLQFMPQQIGRMFGRTTVRELLASVSPMPYRQHGLALIRAEQEMAESPSDEAGVRLGDAIARWGESGGYAHVENPNFEGKDVRRLVRLISNLGWVRQDGPGDPRLGAVGGSYGGGYQFLGAFESLRVRGKPVFDGGSRRYACPRVLYAITKPPERRAVQLATRRHRQPIERYKTRRNHVVRQRAAEA